MTVFFSLPLSYMPGYDFAFLPNGMGGGGTPNTFDPATTNGQNVAYSAFLVPFDGTISNLTIRLDLATVASSEISPELTFTVYASSTTLGASSALGSWTATALELSTGILTMAPGSSLTAAFQNVTNTAAVAAGTILTVVVHSEGLATFDLQPAHLSASFSYSPN